MNEIIMELILKQNSQIERLFDRFDVPTEEVELNCINIIKQLRTLIEHIVTYYYGMEQKIEQRMDKDALRTIVAFMKKPENNVPFLVKLHNYLQASSSHYVIDEVSAPRLLSKYLPYLYETKKWFFIKFGHNILNNLSIFSKTQINGMYEYYSAINKKISSHPIKHFEDNKERYYVYKSIPIFDGEYIYYETTIGIASNYASKFNRFIVFSRFKIDER